MLIDDEGSTNTDIATSALAVQLHDKGHSSGQRYTDPDQTWHTQGNTSQKTFKSSTTNEPTWLAHPLTPSLTDNYMWEWFSVCKQVLMVAKWEGSVGLVHIHHDPALWVCKTQ